jgi:hypothetical protein
VCATNCNGALWPITSGCEAQRGYGWYQTVTGGSGALSSGRDAMASTIGPQGSSAAAVAPGTGSPSDPLGALLCRRPISNRSAGWGNVRAVPDAPQVPIVASRRGRLESKCRNEETAGNSSILVDSLNSTCEPKASAGGTQRQIRSPRRPCPKYTCRRSSRRASGSWTPSCAWCYGYEPSRSTRSSGARKR